MAAQPFKWQGVDAFRRGLRAIPPALRREKLGPAMLDAVEPMAAAMAAGAARSKGVGRGWGTGRHMADGVGARLSDADRRSSWGVRVEVGPYSPAPPYEFFYDEFLEFGTSKMPARPFVRPAWDGHKDDAMQRIADFVQGIYDRAMRRAA